MSLFLDDGDVRLYHGDALEQLRGLPDGCVDMVATSPPFYGLRDYGTGTWEGGDEGCDHRVETSGDKKRRDEGRSQTGTFNGSSQISELDAPQFRDNCGKCGARRVDRQIGLEETPDEWVQNLVAVFRECRRVLADHGTLWVEIGDSYCSSSGGVKDGDDRSASEIAAERGYAIGSNFANYIGRGRASGGGLGDGRKPKDLLGQPWLLAFALRADGWYLRSEIIWARPNPMPESVTDRPTKSHSTIFLLSKRPRYFYDADAIREAFAEGHNGRMGPNSHGRIGEGGFRRVEGVKPVEVPQSETLDGSSGEPPRGPDGRRQTAVQGRENSEQHRDGERWPNPSGANARSVWTIPTEPTPFAHFATWPRKLVARMILAGTSERGKCPECGKPWVRETETDDALAASRRGTEAYASRGLEAGNRFASATPGVMTTRRTLGWSPSCACHFGDGLGPRNPVPCTVLDPFAGSGTTLLVARQHGRHAIGIELNADYCRIAADRLSQLSLLTEAQA